MIRNPFRPGDPIYDMAFNFFAMEEEGLLPTHKGCLNHFCQMVMNGEVDIDNPAPAFEEAMIDWVLTPDELDYIYKKTGYYFS